MGSPVYPYQPGGLQLNQSYIAADMGAIAHDYSRIPFSWMLDFSKSAHVILGIAILLLAHLVNKRSRKLQNPSKLPMIGRKWYEIGYGKAKSRFNTDADGIIRSSLQKYGDAFFLYTDYRFRLILSPKYADAIRNSTRLSFTKAIQEQFHAGIPGFEPLAQSTSASGIIQAMTKQVFTRSLGTFIEPLYSESAHAIQSNWTDETEPHEAMLKDTIWKIVGQVMSRSFINEDIARNPEWVSLSTNLVYETFLAARDLRYWPKSMRKTVSLFLPGCQKVRALIERAREILEPVVKAEAMKCPVSSDREQWESPINWLKDAAEGHEHDIASWILALCVAGYDTSSELLCHTLTDLSENPQLVQDLRSEIVSIVGREGGFNKASLQDLVLMDSVIKESQRLRPVSYVSMQRMATEQLTLPDGIIIPKGTAIMVSGCHMMDTTVWPDGDQFDGYRFFNLRQSSETAAQAAQNFVSTGSNHMGFGHGNQACPGRFFAAYTIKIILCHILLKYDFKVVVPEAGRSLKRAHNIASHPELKINLRRRREEMVLQAAQRKT